MLFRLYKMYSRSLVVALVWSIVLLPNMWLSTFATHVWFKIIALDLHIQHHELRIFVQYLHAWNTMLQARLFCFDHAWFLCKEKGFIWSLITYMSHRGQRFHTHKKAYLRNIIHIHYNVLWDCQQPMECFEIFPTFNYSPHDIHLFKLSDYSTSHIKAYDTSL